MINQIKKFMREMEKQEEFDGLMAEYDRLYELEEDILTRDQTDFCRIFERLNDSLSELRDLVPKKKKKKQINDRYVDILEKVFELFPNETLTAITANPELICKLAIEAHKARQEKLLTR